MDNNIKLICCDLDGTLYHDSFELYDNVLETLELLREQYKLAFVTNTTSVTWAALSQQLLDIGILKEAQELFTPGKVAQQVLTKNNIAHGILLADSGNREEFDFFKNDPHGSSVLVATEGYDLTFADLTPALQLLLNNAQLFTLQKNRFYMKDTQVINDMGAVCAALEYSAHTEAVILGKPGYEIYNTVSEMFSVNIDEMAIVGDDIEFDVYGAMQHGITGILVKTGKYSQTFADATGIVPDMQIDTFAALPQALSGLGVK